MTDRCILTAAALRHTVTQWDTGEGFDAAVEAFAKAVPVASRTVYYWLAGRKMHPVFEARVREMDSAGPVACRSMAQRKREKEAKGKRST